MPQHTDLVMVERALMQQAAVGGSTYAKFIISINPHQETFWIPIPDYLAALAIIDGIISHQ